MLIVKNCEKRNTHFKGVEALKRLYVVDKPVNNNYVFKRVLRGTSNGVYVSSYYLRFTITCIFHP